MNFFSHLTAIIDPGASIGAGTKIWHFCHVSAGAKIGERCNLGQNVFIGPDVIIGSNVKIQNNVSVYPGAIIEDDVFLGPSCVLTNVTNPRSQVVRHSLYEKTLFRRGCTVGANATIVCGITLGCYAFIAAGTVVSKDVPDYALMVGVPGRQHGWMSRHGHRLSFGKDGIAVCPESRFRYELVSSPKPRTSHPEPDLSRKPDVRPHSVTPAKAGVQPNPLRWIPACAGMTGPHTLCVGGSHAPCLVRCLDLDEDQPLPEKLSKGSKAYDEYK